MKRLTPVAFVVLLAALVALVHFQRVGAGSHAGAGPTTASASATALAGGSAKAADADAGPLFGLVDPLDSPAGRASLDDVNEDAGALLADGGTVPDIAGESPASVVFGVVLVQYAGAQGAPLGARTHEEALQLATELVELGRKDFKAAVERGDPGSTTNAGRMYRGVLEPAPAYVLFSLAKDEVSEPVDTPRGFWVVKRLD